MGEQSKTQKAKKTAGCARCEEPIKGMQVRRDAPPYAGGVLCVPCDKDLRSGTVPDEPVGE
jgi:hypothetical protein